MDEKDEITPTKEDICRMCGENLFEKNEGMLHFRNNYLCLRCARIAFLTLEGYIQDGQITLTCTYEENEPVIFFRPEEATP